VNDVTGYFYNNYAASRQRFLEACAYRGFEIESYIHPQKGIDGEELATDVTRIGLATAENLIIVTSATHGVEGFGGSGVQVGCLIGFNQLQLPENTAVLLVHGVNPFGFSWLRRVNEDNVDMNRNFVDHEGKNYPENDLFETLYPYAMPKEWSAEAHAWCDNKIAEMGEKYDPVTVRKSLTKGQYTHSDSVHYGGDFATWSNQTLHEICTKALSGVKRAVLIDLHTGLGPYGYGELMTPSKPGEAEFDRLFDCFGDEVHSTTAGSSNYAGSKGSILAGFRPGSEQQEWTSVGLEFGTIDSKTVAHAMRGDIWLYAYGDPASPLADEIRGNVRDAFYIDESKWKNMLWERGREVIQRVIDKLSKAA
jgi:hypothetical protein